jgi:hypothetical protein
MSIITSEERKLKHHQEAEKVWNDDDIGDVFTQRITLPPPHRDLSVVLASLQANYFLYTISYL